MRLLLALLKVFDCGHVNLRVVDGERVILLLVDIDTCFPRAPRHAVLEVHVGRIEVGDLLDGLTHLAQRDTPAPVDFEHARQQVVDFFRDREDGGEEVVRVLEVRLEGAVVRRRRLPRVAASDEVKENDSQRPDVVK